MRWNRKVIRVEGMEIDMKKRKNKTIVMNIGTSSMLVILTGLSFAVLAALAISSARNDYSLSMELAEHTMEYYGASDRAQEILIHPEKLYLQRDFDGYAEFTVPVNQRQELVVGVSFLNESMDSYDYDITKWKIVNTGDWEGDTSLPVLQAP